MKKTFNLKTDNKTPERQADSIKHEVRKYLKRERKKELVDGSDYWDFACKIGKDEATSKSIHTSEINSSIDEELKNESDSFYLEILAKPGHRLKKKPTKN